jgi:hypothetical protein
MTLTNLKTVLQTVTVTSVKLAAPADRIGLGFGEGHNYPTADSLSQRVGRFPTPPNPEPEPVRSRQEFSATHMRKQMRTDSSGAVPPASWAGCLTPGLCAARVSWSLTSGITSWSVTTTDTGRDHSPKVRVVDRVRIGRDCQSPDRINDKRALVREVAPATAAGK